jgi:hypothetical protein
MNLRAGRTFWRRNKSLVLARKWSALLTQYCSGDQIENNEIGRACSAYGGKGEMYTGFWLENLRERDHLEDPGVDGRIILR